MMANLIAAQRHSGCSTTFQYTSEKKRDNLIAASGVSNTDEYMSENMMANVIAAQRHSGCSATFKYKSEK